MVGFFRYISHKLVPHELFLIPFPVGHTHSQWFTHTNDDLETLQAAPNNKKRKEMKKVGMRGRGGGTLAIHEYFLYPPTCFVGCYQDH